MCLGIDSCFPAHRRNPKQIQEEQKVAFGRVRCMHARLCLSRALHNVLDVSVHRGTHVCAMQADGGFLGYPAKKAKQKPGCSDYAWERQQGGVPRERGGCIDKVEGCDKSNAFGKRPQGVHSFRIESCIKTSTRLTLWSLQATYNTLRKRQASLGMQDDPILIDDPNQVRRIYERRRL